MKAMLLAAGKGERMLPLTLEMPKPLLEAGGKSLISHQIERLAAGGITDLVINHAWLGEQIEKTLGNGESYGVNITWSREHEPLETAGGILQALPLLQDNTESSSFICVNSDIWTDYSFINLPELKDNDLLAWLVLVDNPTHHTEGDFVLSDERVSLLDNEQEQRTLTFSGIAVYHTDLFTGMTSGKQSVVPLLKKAMATGQVGGEYFGGQWYDIGTPERLVELDKLLQ